MCSVGNEGFIGVPIVHVIELSDGRTLEATLLFSNAWPTVKVI
jgi:hypothetical protein